MELAVEPIDQPADFGAVGAAAGKDGRSMAFARVRFHFFGDVFGNRVTAAQSGAAAVERQDRQLAGGIHGQEFRAVLPGPFLDQIDGKAQFAQQQAHGA